MRLNRFAATCAAAALLAAITITLNPAPLRAQEGSGGAMGMESDQGGTVISTPLANDPSMPPPMAKIHIRQPITGSMMASPPYGIAPMRVGFFVLANDPEGIGFLTYSWNFGDGTVSALPPELYIFHTYKKPGTYLCSLVIKTVDGRSKAFMQGVLVRPPGD
jgi:hypothetical protein